MTHKIRLFNLKHEITFPAAETKLIIKGNKGDTIIAFDDSIYVKNPVDGKHYLIKYVLEEIELNPKVFREIET
jgi:hypothetical protein